MARSIYAVLLAGRLRPTPLGNALDIPVLTLPVGLRGSLLDHWLQTLDEVNGLREVRVVVNTPLEVAAVNGMAGRSTSPIQSSVRITVMPEPAPWRGAAGIVRDVMNDVTADDLVIVCEAKRLPPQTVSKLLECFSAEADVSGSVGICGSDEPAGVYVMNGRALSLIPEIGYFDMKEQLLPALRREGHRVVCQQIASGVWPVNDRESYLASVRQTLLNGSHHGDAVRISPHACVEPTARLSGCCIVEDGAVIDANAVVHDSVVLWGATIGEGAVVTRSVVGSLGAVPPRAMVRDVVHGRESAWADDHRFAGDASASSNRLSLLKLFS